MEQNRENEQKPKKERATRKQITFDLSDKKLRIFYPKPKFNINPKYHNKAWGDIARFMKKNGFEHRQRSVYASLNPMTRAEVLVLVDSMVEKMPWLSKCLNAIDVTNIGRQHSLMQAVENSAIKLEAMEKEHEKETEEKGDTMKDWKGKIEKEKAESSTEKSENRIRTQKEKTDR